MSFIHFAALWSLAVLGILAFHVPDLRSALVETKLFMKAAVAHTLHTREVLPFG